MSDERGKKSRPDPPSPAVDQRRDSKASRAASPPAVLEELEARVLLSTWTLQDGGSGDAGEAIEQQLSNEELARLAMRDEQETFDLSGSADGAESASYELVFVDAGVEGYDRLLVDLFGNDSDTSRSVEVVVLSADRDGVEQISDALGERTGVSAIHLIAHGEDGTLQIGNGEIDAGTLAARREEIEGWSAALGTDADILIYGCDLASTTEGKTLVSSLAKLTGADIAASDDLTGASALGGDWDLEYQVGQIEAQSFAQDEWQSNWVGTLDIESGLVAHYRFDEGSGSVAIDAAGGDDTGTLSGTPTPGRVAGHLGEALDFSAGGDDLLTVADSADLDFGSGDFSISYWYNTTQTPTGAARLVGKLDNSGNPGFVTFTDSFGDVNLTVDDGSNAAVLFAGGQFDGGWHLFTAVRTGNLFELYVDGTLVDSDTVALGSIDNNDMLYMGGSPGAPESFDGQLDDVRLYNRALTSSDITELYAHTEASVIAADDTVSVDEANSVVIDPTANDAGAGTLSVLEFTQPSLGVVIDNGDGTLTYTAADGAAGADSFEYKASDSSLGLSHYWGLDGEVTDAVGGTDGVVYGTAPVPGAFGNGLAFNDATEDYALIPDVSYASEFTMSFDFKVDDNSGSLFQYLYSHGDVDSPHSLNVFLNEASHGTDPNVLRTVLRDANDTLDNQALEIDATSLIGTGWHTYTVTAGSSGIEVFIDGVSVATDATRGTDAFAPTGGLFLGSRQDQTSGRFLNGALDSVQIYDNVLDSAQIAALHSSQDVATVNVTIDPVNDAPTFEIGDGVVETSFSSLGGGFRHVAIQPDGKIVVLGSINTAETGQDIDYALARYHADGSLDTTFGDDGFVYNAVTANNELPTSLLLQPDGKILVAGGYSPTSTLDSIVMRYDADGNLDPTFAGDGTLEFDVSTTSTDFIQDMVLQDDGKILVTGYGRFSGQDDAFVARIDANGVLDNSFDGDGIRLLNLSTGDDRGNAIAVQPDGRILIAGQSSNGTDNDLVVVRLDANGNNDPDFDGDGIFQYDSTASDSGTTLAVDAGGRIVVGGWSNLTGSGDSIVLRINPDGELDTNFGSAGVATIAAGSPFEAVNDIAIQSDGKILVAGDAYNGSNNDLSLLRLNVNGTLDTDFDGDGLVRNDLNGATDSGKTLVIDDDGSILVAGNTSLDVGTPFVVRYDADGALVEQFALVNTLEANPTFVQGGDPVVLDADVQIFDEELSAKDDFAGASLTLSRSGGPSGDDTFVATGTLGALTPGTNNLVLDGTTIGSVTTNAGGVLVLTFNSNATNARVNDAMRQIAYQNTSVAPPTTAQIDWTFDDGNSTEQGSGGAQQALGSVEVRIASNRAPTDLSSGVEINTDGGNDAYLIADNGSAILGDLASLTFETIFLVSETRPDNVLISYSTENASSHFQVEVKDYGDLFVRVNGIAGSFTGFDYSDLLLDGEPHHFALTWDSTNGDIAIFVDGQIVESKSSFFAGEIIAGGPGNGTGQLLFGQDRDTTNDAFDPDEGLNGTFYDIRIWDEVRTEAEIALHHEQQFDATELPDGLIANWQMKALSGAGTNEVIDIISGNNLTVQTVATPITAFVNTTTGVTTLDSSITFSDDATADGWTAQTNSTSLSSLGYTDDYKVSFTIDNMTNGAFMIGLSETESMTDRSDIDNAIYVDGLDSNWYVMNNGAEAFRQSGVPVAGDDFTFYVHDGIVEYQLNGETFFSQSFTPTANTYLDSSFYTESSGSYSNQDDYTLSDINIQSDTFVSSEVSDSLSVLENAPNGTRVGFVLPTDPDAIDDVVSDGRFVEEDPFGFTHFIAGESFGGWSVDAGEVVLNDETIFEPSPSGGYALELGSSAAPGQISQTLTTEIGREYQVTFYASADWSGTINPKSLEVTAGGTTHEIDLERPDGWAYQNVGWEPQTFTFVAQSTSTQLSFASLSGASSYSPLIADVQVIAVPAAVSDILNQDATLSYDAATDKFYRNVNTYVLWQDAQDAAIASELNGISGQLVTIHSEYENELVRNMTQSAFATWLGGADIGNEGNFSWYEGAEAGDQFWTGGELGGPANGAYTNFQPDQPNNSGDGQHVVYQEAGTGLWDDGDQTTGYGTYIVEWDASEVVSNFTFSLDDDADGRFAIDALTGEITVADGSKLDYEDETEHDIQVRTYDATGASYFETMTIQVDDAFETYQTVPPAQSVSENQVLTFTGANAISVSDAFPGTDAQMQVTLSVGNGDLRLSSLTGITMIEGFQGSSSITFSGTESDLNSALDGMTFTPDPNFVGAVELEMTTTLSADLAGLYTFAGGAANDESKGTTYSGTLNGNATTTTDLERGEVLRLDDPGDFVRIDGLIGEPADVTLAAWINADSVDSSGAVVISMGISPALYLNGDGTLIGFYESGGSNNLLQSSDSLVGTGWHHVALSIDAANSMTLYIDGVAIETSTPIGVIEYDNSPDTYIGRAGDGLGGFDFGGLIDDARIYSRSLSAEEVSALAADLGESSDSVAITVTPVNDAPTIAHFAGDYVEAINDGTAFLLDAVRALDVADIDSANFDGGTLTLDGNGFDVLDRLDIDTSGAVSLSSGMTNGSVVSVSGVAIGTLSGVSDAGFSLSLNASSTSGRVETVLQSISFESTSTAFGSRTVDIALVDGDGIADGGSDTVSLSLTINLASSVNGQTLAAEDTPYVYAPSDFDFTGVVGTDLREITLTSIPASGSLRLNGVSVTAGQTITYAEINSGLLTFEAAANQEGDGYASFDFYVNNGHQSATVLPGEYSGFGINSVYLGDTDAILESPNNFGPSGTFSTNVQFESTNSTIDATYLSRGEIYFGGYVSDGVLDAAELAAIETWVDAGGVLISTNDDANYDSIAEHFGLVIGGSASSIWEVADTSTTIINGTFGSVGNVGDTFSASGTISYFDSASLAAGDVVIATDSVSGEPTIVMRAHGDGWILFTGDEGPFRSGMTGDGTVSTPNDILAANVFAWAIDSAPKTTLQMDIDVSAVNDAPIFSAPAGYSIFTEGSTGYAQNADTLVLSDGSMLLLPYDENGDSALVKLNPDGSIDTTFGTDGFATNPAGAYFSAIEEQPDGQLVVAGSSGSDFHLLRFNANGTLDTSFGTGGQVTTDLGGSDGATDVALQADGKIIVIGDSGADSVVVRYNANGTIDTSFDIAVDGDGIVRLNLGGSFEKLLAVEIQADGKIIAAGETSIVRLDTAGALDPSFDGDGIVDAGYQVSGLAIQADGRVIVTGYNGNNELTVSRFDSDGTPDGTFGTSGEAIWNSPLLDGANGTDIVQQADGKIVVGGYSDTYPNQWLVVRFESNGTLDTTFASDGAWISDPGSDFSEAYSISLYDNGSSEDIIIGGYSSIYTAAATSTIVRLDSNGVLDAGLTSSSLDGRPTFVEGGSPVVLDADVTIFDREMSPDYDFGGATLTLARTGGANSDDLFSATGNLVFNAGTLELSASSVGTYTQIDGELVITFGADVEELEVSEVMQSLAYANLSGAPPTEVQIDWVFDDGNIGGIQGSGGPQQATGSTTVDITATNDAPTLNSLGASFSFSPIAEDDTAPAGDTVADLIASAGGDRITDPDAGAVEGIAITFADSTNGTWQFSTNGGGSWQTMVSPSSGNAVLLDASARLRFVPSADWNGNANVSFRAWDQTDGRPNGTTGVSIAGGIGGSGAYSTGLGTAWATVQAANDDPVLTTGPGGGTYFERSTPNHIDFGATLTDADGLDFDGGTLTATLTNNGTANDRLVMIHEGTGAGQLEVDGSNLLIDGVVIGSYSGGVGVGDPLIVTFNAQADATTVTKVVQRTGFENISENPSGLQRQITLQVTDGDGGTSASGVRVMNVIPVNDDPIAEDDPRTPDQILSGDPATLGYWRLGEASGSTASDETGNNSGTYSNVTLGAAGPYGGDTAADFNGTDSHVNLGSIDVDGTGLTMAGWIYVDDFGSNDGRIISKADGTANSDHTWMLSLDDSTSESRLRMRVAAGGTTSELVASSGNLETGRWYHTAATYDEVSGEMNLYLDGEIVGTRTHSTGGAVDQDPTQEVWIGDNPLGSRALDGRIDEVALLDRAMTLSEIQSIASISGAAYSVNEDASLVVDANAGVLANDLDPDGDPLTVSLVSGPSNASSFTLYADGSFDYTGATHFNGTDSFVYQVADGNGGFDTATATITVLSVNDLPTISDPSFPLEFTEQSPAAISPNFTAGDADGTNLQSARLQIAGNYESGADLLEFTDQLGISGSWDAVSGTLTLTGSASVADYQSAIRSIVFKNASDTPSTAQRSVEITVNDGTADSNLLTRLVNVTAVDDSAVLDLDADDSAAAGIDFATSWTEGGGPISVTDTDATLEDVDSANLTGLIVTLTNPSDGALETLAADTTGTLITASYDSGTGLLTLSGSDTKENYQQVLRTITYDNTHATPYGETRVLSFAANDGTSESTVATTTVSMNVSRGVLIVSNLSDTVNGDTTDINTLIASQGGDGISLREAIIATNNSANGPGGPDVIRFDVSGPGPHVISLTGQLPTITETILIDGTSEPDFAGTPMVVLDGSAAGATAKGLYLAAGSDGSEIRGLAIHSFAAGIEIDGSDNNVVAGNYFGLAADGVTVSGNSNFGIRLVGGSANNTIGGVSSADRNVIAGTTGDGIQLSGAGTTGNQVLGNYVGTDASGTTAAANAIGIRITDAATDNFIGSTASDAGNLISGNTNYGVFVSADADRQTFEGNWIGIDASGTTALGNGAAGLQVSSTGNVIGGTAGGAGNVISGNGGAGLDLRGDTNSVLGNIIGLGHLGSTAIGNSGAGVFLSNGADNNTIGGPLAGARNVISDNVDGIYIQASVGTTIQGNLIGTDITGQFDRGNSDRGIQVESGGNNTTIGGTAIGAGNVISGNGTDGIILSDGSNPGAGTTNVIIQGNLIGVALDGTTALGNDANGIRITTVSGNVIGGTEAGAGNIIANSGQDGIVIGDASATDNTILSNLIYANTEFGIDLGNNNVSLNDAAVNLDGDVGANQLQNFPVLYTADIFGTDLLIAGDLDSEANTSYRIEFFSNPLGQEDSSGYGEAREFLGFAVVTTDAAGNASISTTLSGVSLSAGDRVSSTATKIVDPGQLGTDERAAYGETSEFSQNLPASTGDPAPTINLDADSSSGGGPPNYVTSFSEDGGPVLIADSDATLFDPDSPNLASLTVTITNPADGAAELLAANTTGTSIVASYDSGTGILTLLGSDTVENYEQVLRTITYENTSQGPDTSQRFVSFIANDGTNNSNFALTAISMSASNDAAILDLDADDSVETGLDFAATWTEDGGPILVVDADADLSDVDSANLASLTVTLTNPLDFAAESLAADTTGTLISANYDSSTGILTLSGSDTVENYEQVLRTVTYDSASQTPNETTRVITFEANDGGDPSTIATTTVQVVALAEPGVTITASGIGGLGNQTTVNESSVYVGGTYLTEAIAVDADGNSVVVWTSNDATLDGAGTAIVARLFDASGNPIGGEFVVNTTGAGSQTDPSVAMDEDGNFVVMWTSWGQDGSSGGIYAQRFDASGTPQGTEFQVHTTTAGSQDYGSIAMGANGGFTIVWEGAGVGDTRGIFGQRYDANGTALGGEFRINDTIAENQTQVEIDSDDAGNFVVTWTSGNQDGSGRGVYAKIFDALGNAQSGEILVNGATSGDQWISDVAMTGSGEFAIVYRDDVQAGGIYLQLFAADGSKTGSEIQVPTTVGAGFNYPRVAMDDAGNVTVVWQDFVDGNDYASVARQFDATGSPLGAQFIVNTHTEWYQEYPAIAMTGDGQFNIVFTDYDANNDAEMSIEMRVFGASTTEAGGTASFDFVLDTQPTDDVTITLSMPDGTEGTLSTTTLTFTASDWNIAQTVTVTGVDDALADGDITHALITSSASSTDPNYSGLEVADLRITNLDDDPSIDLDADNSDAPGIDFATSWTEGGGPVVIVDTDAILTDPDSTQLSSLNVTITNPLDGSLETLAADTTGTSIVATYNSGTGILSLSGTDSIENYQQVLRTVTYDNTSQDPDETQRLISFEADDGTNQSLIASTTVSVAGVNDAPVVGYAGLGNPIEFTEQSPVGLAPEFTVTDADSDLTGATIEFTANYEVGVDQLSFTNQLGISGSFDGPSGTLTLTGTASASDYQTAIRSIVFRNNSDTPSELQRAVEITVTDGTDPSNALQRLININPVNDAPTANTDSASVNEGASVIINLAGNDTDPDNSLDLSSVVITSGPANGSLVDNGDGTFTYTHNGSETTGDTFRYTLQDASGALSNEATVSITVDPVNDAPIADDDGAIVNEGASILIDVAVNDSDADDGLNFSSIVITTAPSNGTLIDNGDGTLTYTHDGSETTSDAFFYDIKDLSGETSNPARVDINITPQNDTPILGNNALTIDEGGAVTLTSLDLAATDAESAAADLIFQTSSVNGGFFEATSNPGVSISNFTQGQLTNGEIRFVHDGGESAPSYLVSVTDGADATAPIAATISFTNLNDAPSLDLDADDSTTVGSGFDATFTTLGGPVAIVDTDASVGDPDTDLVALTVTLTNLSDLGSEFLSADTTGTTISASYDANTGVLSLSGSASASDYQQVLRTIRYDNSAVPPDTSARVIAFVADDGFDLSNVAESTVQMVVPNLAPTAADDSAGVSEGESVIIDLTANDSDYEGQLDPGSIAITSGPSHGSVQILGDGTIRYTHDGSETTSDSFQYTISDQPGLVSNVATISVSVAPVNDAPITQGDAYALNEDAVLNISTGSGVLANDSDAEGNSLSAQLVTGPSHANSFQLHADGSFDYVPAPDYYGADSFSYRVSDGSATSGITVVNLTVVSQNDAPTMIANTGATAIAGFGNTISASELNATDVDDLSSDLVFTLVSTPAVGSLELTTNPGVAISSFSQADIDAGRLRYYIDSATATVDNFVFDVTDPSGATTGSVTFTMQITQLPGDFIDDPTPDGGGGGDDDGSGGDNDDPGSTDPDDPNDSTDDPERPDEGDPDPDPSDPSPTPAPPILIETRLEFEILRDDGSDDDLATSAAELFSGARRLDPAPNPFAAKAVRLAEMSPLALENTVFDALSLSDEEHSRESGEMELDVEVWVARTEQLVMAAGLGLVAALLRTGSLLALTATSVPLWKGLDPVAALLISDRRRDQLADEANFAERIEDETDDVGRILDDEPSESPN